MIRLSRCVHQSGMSLIELLVSLAISMVIVIAASAFFLSSSRSRDTQDAAGTLQDNARFATEIITKTIQQAGYQNYVWNTLGAAGRREVLPPSDGQPDIRGYNNAAAGSSIDFTSSSWGHNKSSNRVNNSDALMVRFQGSGIAPGDGSMIDCMGRPQPVPVVPGDRAYSIFEVYQASITSEPELRCKYVTTSLNSEPIVRGVETLQLMYGVCTKCTPCTDATLSNYDPVADRWLNAAEVDAINTANPAAAWALVRSVRVGMVLRSPDRVAVTTSSSGTATLTPLGENFSQNVATYPDTLTVNNSDGRLRRTVTFTVNLRNTL
jgi:type IV pilus assembly protein PilW